MNITIIWVVAILVWVILSYIVGTVASSMGRAFSSYFILSLFISPIFSLLILIAKGKPTEAEKAEYYRQSTPHIFYCSFCNAAFSGTSDTNQECPQCKGKLIETSIDRDDWRTYSEEKKDQMKRAFAEGQYSIDTIMEPSKAVQNSPLSPADEIKKYKDLLDNNAITQEEFDAKKKQLLNL